MKKEQIAERLAETEPGIRLLFPERDPESFWKMIRTSSDYYEKVYFERRKRLNYYTIDFTVRNSGIEEAVMLKFQFI